MTVGGAPGPRRRRSDFRIIHCQEKRPQFLLRPGEGREEACYLSFLPCLILASALAFAEASTWVLPALLLLLASPCVLLLTCALDEPPPTPTPSFLPESIPTLFLQPCPPFALALACVLLFSVEETLWPVCAAAAVFDWVTWVWAIALVEETASVFTFFLSEWAEVWVAELRSPFSRPFCKPPPKRLPEFNPPLSEPERPPMLPAALPEPRTTPPSPN